MNAAPVYPTPDMIGTPRSGLLLLRNATAAYFADRSIPAVVAPVGLKYRSFILNQGPGGGNRVVFIPGVFDGSNTIKARSYGVLEKSARGHQSVVNPRELLGWQRPATLSVWSAPVPGAKDDEGETIGLAEDLLELVVRAIQEAAGADVTWGGVTINAPPVQGGFGVELLVSITQRGPIYDVTRGYAQPATGKVRNP